MLFRVGSDEEKEPQMNSEVEFLVRQARELMCKISTGDRAMEDLCRRTSALSGEISSLREYQTTIDSVNAATTSGERRRCLLDELQRENKLIDKLSKENQDLRAYTKETLQVIQLLTEKHREMAVKMKRTPNIPEHVAQAFFQVDQEKKAMDCRRKAIQKKFVQKMEEILKLAEQEEIRNTEYCAQIAAENNGLRELLSISHSSIPNGKRKFAKIFKQKLEDLKQLESDEDEEDEKNKTAIERKVTAVEKAPPADESSSASVKTDEKEEEEDKNDDDDGSENSEELNNTILRRPPTSPSSPPSSSSC